LGNKSIEGEKRCEVRDREVGTENIREELR
jgi:hypothetical protein